MKRIVCFLKSLPSWSSLTSPAVVATDTIMSKMNCSSNSSLTEEEADKVFQQMKGSGSLFPLVEIGANFTCPEYKDSLDDVVKRAVDAGVKKFLVTGLTVKESDDAYHMVKKHPQLMYSTAGVHPYWADSWKGHDSLNKLRELLAHPEVVAVGECGLDYHDEALPPKKEQQVAFKAQLLLAIEVNKPMFLHEREAHDDFISILEEVGFNKLPPIVVHCFTGNRKEIKKYLDLGFFIGQTGYYWNDEQEDGPLKMLQDGTIPLDRLMIETDCPYMTPNLESEVIPKGMKGKITPESSKWLEYCTEELNEPCSLPVVMEGIAYLMGKSPEKVAYQTSLNALKVFGLNK